MTDVPTPTGHDVYWEKWVDAYETDIEIVEEDKAFDEEESEFGISFESMEEQEEIQIEKEKRKEKTKEKISEIVSETEKVSEKSSEKVISKTD